jgi:hypothetical protein
MASNKSTYLDNAFVWLLSLSPPTRHWHDDQSPNQPKEKDYHRKRDKKAPFMWVAY